MTLTWNNNTAAQNLTAIYVSSNSRLVVAGTVAPSDSFKQDVEGPAAMGFAGNWEGFQVVFFPQNDQAFASASDGSPGSGDTIAAE